MTFDGFVAYQAQQRPGDPAILTQSGTLSFAQLDRMIDRFTGALAGLQLPADTICAVQFKNPVTHWIVVLALARIGVCSACASDAAASFRITDQPGEDANSFAASDDWVQRISQAVPAPRRFARPAPSARGRILLTSGTMGPPKRVGLSWELIERHIRNALIAYGPLGLGPWLIEAGIDTAFGFTVPLAAWATGHGLLFRGDLDIAELLRRFAPALLGMVPIQLQHELRSLPAGFERIDTMRVILAGGLPTPALAQEARRRLTAYLRIVYGASECGAATILDSRLLDGDAGAIGYALPGVTIELVDESGQPVADGERGEVRIRSDRLSQDYPAAIGETSSPLRQGWLYPGDLGRRRADGLLLLEGRRDDLMNIGGVKVLPAYVESALRGTPGIADLAVFADPEATRVGQWYVAVVLEPGADRDAVLEGVRARQPPLPLAHLLYLANIPRNALGKVERLKLIEIARETGPAADQAGAAR